MVSILNTYALAIVTFDLIMLTTALLFRKPKNKSRISTLDRKLIELTGYYLVASAVIVLAISHLMILFHSYVCYYAGLSLDVLMFFMGMVISHG